MCFKVVLIPSGWWLAMIGDTALIPSGSSRFQWIRTPDQQLGGSVTVGRHHDDPMQLEKGNM